MQDVFIEYMVKRKPNATTTLIRVGLVVGVVILCPAVMLFSGFLGALSIIAPLLVVGALYGAYHVFTSQNVEFEYSVTNGEMDVDKIIAQRKRKRLVTVKCREVEGFGRYKPQEHEGKSYQTKIFACDSVDSDNLWYCTVRLKEAGFTLVVFNANDKMLGGIKPFLPRPIAHEAFRFENNIK